MTDYGHTEGCWVTGGYVYRGRAVPALKPGGAVTSFGEDANGELYVLLQSGTVFRIIAK